MSAKTAALLAVLLLMGLMPGHAFSAPVEWTDWQSTVRDGAAYTSAQGNIGGDVDVAYTGSAWSVLTDCSSSNYWTEPGPGPAPYTGSSLIDNGPECDVIRLNWASSNTITFSQPIWMPLMAIISLGDPGIAVPYDFGEGVLFSVLSAGQGLYGDGTYSLGDGSITGNEFHGVIQFDGWVTQLTWTSTTAELWHGFTLGRSTVPAPPEPVPALAAPAQIVLSAWLAMCAQRAMGRRRSTHERTERRPPQSKRPIPGVLARLMMISSRAPAMPPADPRASRSAAAA